MGTRGLLGVILRDRRKKGTYNHFNSFPEILGVNTVKFIKSLTEEQIEQMKERMEHITWVDEDERPSAQLQVRYGAASLADLGVNRMTSNDWYCLIRKAQGANALPLILDGTLEHLMEYTDFADNKLHCEWVYWIDWEKRELIVENGANAKAKFEDLSEEWVLGVRPTQDQEEDEEVVGEYNEGEKRKGSEDGSID